MAQAMKTTLRPLRDRILVKRLEEQDEKPGSLIVPDTAKEKPQEGQVVAVGTGKVNDNGNNLPLAVKAGDRRPDLQAGYSTSGGLELGVSGVRRLMAEFEMMSQVDKATLVTVGKWTR